MTRRELLKRFGAVGAGSLVKPDVLRAQPQSASAPRAATGGVIPLVSTSDVFIPPRGQSFMKFSYDFPEPSVQVGRYRIGFLVFTHENTYGMDAGAMQVDVAGNRIRLTCDRFVWAGGQQTAPGSLTATFEPGGDVMDWEVTAKMPQPIKSVTAVIRGVPRGRVSAAGAPPADPQDNELLFGYPFSAGDLDTAAGLTTPFVAVVDDDGACTYISSRDDRVRAKRIYLQPGDAGYRVEAVFETEGWLQQTEVRVPRWRIGRASLLDAAVRDHYAHVERAYRLQKLPTRPDAPSWMRDTALALTLHGMHYTGYIFNDYARMLEILRWVGERLPADRVLAFIAAWDGRYYWNYPLYRADDRMGGEAGFKRLIQEGRRLGFHMMPMFGTNAANTKLPNWPSLSGAATSKIDGDAMPLNWVDWDNDRHMDGWLAYMNLGVDAWRTWMIERISDVLQRYEPDAYFLDIVGGWTNNTKADMHEGTRRLILDLRQRHPQVAVVGEMHYDALLEFIPMYHAGPGAPIVAEYARFFQHLSHPAPGRGSSGVHESGFGHWNPQTLSLSPTQIPTLNIADDTFSRHRTEMEAIIAEARRRAAI